ncbi:hypothetical protein [Novosphingobium album (ex Hu et al. 2023)]|uniref:DUF3035 domain-containing protein n=1 Tax=Novosphingobium album (ex Hu et al. 2023) TaxID=2930093 RepID=A0ABT0B064_9SPHN|nr:hypothetical protein [Novosphingobium album (ex Hu et al. 2023)]MCJ2178446.1 hypothetical protein [Novosphingobium album (ex Hu et al. 2023)]
MTSPTALTRAALVLTLAAALPLGGCKKSTEPGQTTAAGEILPRSVTDDMLPYDTVRSQAPLADPDAAKGKHGPSQPVAAPSESTDTNGTAAAGEMPDATSAQAGQVTPAAE